MGFACGIVGLPNVGKSTLFNALTQTAQAQAANFPFCTIEPNSGVVAVPDKRLDALSSIVNPQKIVPTQMTFTDIAGLVEGAHKGEGLGNQFLANIRECDAILHVVRCFEDGDITHVSGNVDPLRDMDTINTELMLADLATVDKRLESAAKKAKSGDKDAKTEAPLLERLSKALGDGQPARVVEVSDAEHPFFRHMNLLTAKKVLYVCNVSEDDASDGNAFSAKVAAQAANEGAETVIVSAAIEAELAVLDADEQTEFLETLGLEEAGLNRIIRAGYNLLGLFTYFTAGVKEVRAWTVTAGSTAPQAAGKIHGDFERGFIRAETIAFNDFIEFKGEAGAKENGKARQEGKDYVVKDGDVMNFRFNV